jgi:hypothetical protein
MCWNQQVSLNTFLFSFFVLLLIAYNNQYTQYKLPEFNSIYVYLFFLSFMSMQLIEFFIWRNINDKSLNKLFSILGFLLIAVQPIFSLMMLKNEILKTKLLVIYSIFASLLIGYKITNFDINSAISKNGHLKWNWAHFIKYESIILHSLWLLFLIYAPIVNKHYTIMFYVIILYIISMYSFYKDGSDGSLWCWLINTIMIYYAFKLVFWLPFNEHGIC